MKKVYLAGQWVFHKDVKEIAKNLKRLCKLYGLEGLFPTDAELKNPTGKDIYEANVKLINQADIVIAYIEPFRGCSLDVGTAWEIGYAKGLNKQVYAYREEIREYKDRVKGCDTYPLVEDFGLVDNLMIDCCCEVFPSFEDVLKKISKKSIRINLIAPPNRGKTCLSYLLGATLKLNHNINAEVVSEVAKEKAYQGVDLDKETQLNKVEEILEQQSRENLFKNKVSCVITSSPLYMNALYTSFSNNLTSRILNIAKEASEEWEDVYFYLTEDNTMPFQKEGRESWSKTSTREFEPIIKDFFKDQEINLIPVVGSPSQRVDFIIDKIKEII